MLDARKIDPRTGQPWNTVAERDMFLAAVAAGHVAIPDGFEISKPEDIDATKVNPTNGQPWANVQERDAYLGAVTMGFVKLPDGFVIPPPPPPEANSVQLRRMLGEWTYKALNANFNNLKPADFDKVLAAYHENPDAPLFE